MAKGGNLAHDAHVRTRAEWLLAQHRARQKAEAKRVEALIKREAPLQPNEQVLSFQAAAARQRRNAGWAKDRHLRKKYLDQASYYDGKAHEEWERQVAAHIASQADREVVELARIDGGQYPRLKLTETMVADWVRDEHGAIVRQKGLPVLRTETAKARRRTSGLEHIAAKHVDGRPRMAPRLLEVGVWYGHVCAEAAQSALSCSREEIGVPGKPVSKPSPGPADWKLEATRQKAWVDNIFRVAFGAAEGTQMVRILEAICYEGQTPRQYADGDEREGIRVEERLLVALEMLAARRSHDLTARAKQQSKTPA